MGSLFVQMGSLFAQISNYIYDDICNYSGVAQKDSSINWSAIVAQQVMNYTLNSLHFEKCEIV